MTYRVILTYNGQYKKTLHICKTRKTAFINFNKLKEDNKVFYPKRFINTNGIVPVKYEICISKTTEEGDEFRVLRDVYGKLYTEKPLGDWTILHSADYDIEETFYIYGLPKIGKDRPTIKDIIKKLLINAHGKQCVKQIIIVYNKLIIYDENQFDMVICKNLEEAQRLHHTLAKITKKQKLNNIMFMGTASKATIGRMYDMIQKETGWDILKIRRTSTRP